MAPNPRPVRFVFAAGMALIIPSGRNVGDGSAELVTDVPS
jgi:hypothetical protein